MPRYARRRSVKSIIRIAIIPAIALFCIIGLFYAEHTFKQRQRTTWTTVDATAEDTRVRPIARFALEYGSKDLYEIDVLVTYSANETSPPGLGSLLRKTQTTPRSNARSRCSEGQAYPLALGSRRPRPEAR
jgi:hypothetical protein